MKKIFLYLSGSWDISISELAGPSDFVLYAPGLRPPEGEWKSRELPKIPFGHERRVADWLVQNLSNCVQSTARDLVECFLNDFYSYSIRPVIAVISALSEFVEQECVSEIIVVTAKTRSYGIPLIGFQTSESLRGSPNLLMARVANLLPKIFPRIKFEYRYVRGDIFCVESVRRLGVGFANIIYFFLFCFKVLRFDRRYKDVHSVSAFKSIILVRTEHQARFAQRLLNESSAACVAIFPQISQGSLRGLVSLRASLPENVPVCRVSILMLLKAFVASVVDVVRLGGGKRYHDRTVFEVRGVKMPIRFSDLIIDIRLVWTAIFYKNVLSKLLSSTKPDRLINFELVGRMAGLEALAAHENGVEICTVQSALISSVPHTIFPFCDLFYVDSATTLNMIKEIGSKNKGQVLYAGPPYPIKYVRKTSTLNCIAYFTQPYEHEITISIISTLCHWAISNSANVTLRLHPRDRVIHYDELLERFSEVLHCENQKGLEEIIAVNDLCITRTSSVAKEALALGTPILLCLWSNFDRSARADYIVPDPDLGYCAHSDEELVCLLSDPMRLEESAKKLSERMFGGKVLNDLAKDVFNER